MSLEIGQSAALCRVLADATRQRLLVLLEGDALTVAELTEITGLAQSRISTHLGKLREAGMVEDRRHGTSVFYSSNELTAGTVGRVWQTLRAELHNSTLASDTERKREVLRARNPAQTWAESVAGQMELHYSPGRTWEATAHALLPLLDFGDVLDVAAGDGVLAAMVAPRCRSITCVDLSATLVTAGRQRLAPFAQARYLEGDMHHMPLADAQFDTVFLMHALSFSLQPATVLAEIARLLRPGGQTVIATLAAHRHEASVAHFGHSNLGFSPATLKAMLQDAGLEVRSCEVSVRESQAPYFEVIIAHALK